MPTALPGLSVVILSAGRGSRMHSDLPKVLQPLAGRPLLAHVIATAQSLQPTSITVVYGHGGAQVRAAFPQQDLAWALQAQQKGTGHALAQAMPAILNEDLVLVLYGDVPLVSAATLHALVSAAGPTSLAILSVILEDPSGYGRIIRDGTCVSRIVEHKDAAAAELAIHEVNTGLLCAPASVLSSWLAELKNDNAQGEYYLTDIVELARNAKFRVNCVVSPSPAEVLGVNDKLDLARAETAYREIRATELLKAGVTLADPLRVDIRGTVLAGRDVFIDTNVVLEGYISLGNRVHIGTGCVLKNVTLADDTVLSPYCVMEGVIAGESCRIGPFARLRPETILKAEVHIGNFVEVKQSTLGAGSKAGHLTYLGDSSIGERVNIGAGVVTVNYDGARKWSTNIESDAFIGSGSMLIAPLTVRANATIGAGSTIRRDAPADSLTLSRAPQETRLDWIRPKKVPKT
jgi:bifunctional UDP-N-acetylglucosamine pyrophosphorylase / glucosamine-1-phosphate N-acetyltransferase